MGRQETSDHVLEANAVREQLLSEDVANVRLLGDPRQLVTGWLQLRRDEIRKKRHHRRVS